jgi:hypothetical protein
MLTKNKHSVVGQNIEATLKKGGPSISLKSISGNIYLRKSEK